MRRGAVREEGKFPVIGVAPAIIGALQATEALKLLLGIGHPLANRLIVFDGLVAKWQEFTVKSNPNCEDCGHLG
jgi:adenylyltransferase/sulfurtransferase